MLIPFLVIPQIILSGVMVKYEKINPFISSPSEIPVYGEIITARWGYEALAVHQFMENDYEKPFYNYDKAMSIAEYKKNYWILNLKNKLDFVSRYYKNPEHREEVEKDLILIRNEFKKELAANRKVQFIPIGNLTADKLDEGVIEDANTYIDQLNRYYIKLFNKANNQKDNLVSGLQKTPDAREQFLKLKRENYNESLAEFATNSNEVDRIVEYKGHLIQKIDPIYLDPESNYLRAHFYAPRKMFLGTYLSTFWVNVIVIWLMTIILYIALYYRLLLRFLDFLERLGSKE
jgi:hypothetical protein